MVICYRSHTQKLFHDVGFCLCFLGRCGNNIFWPSGLVRKPRWPMPLNIRTLADFPATVFLDIHVPTLEVFFLLDLPDSITAKLFVVSSPFDPVKGDATVKPTVRHLRVEILPTHLSHCSPGWLPYAQPPARVLVLLILSSRVLTLLSRVFVIPRMADASQRKLLLTRLSCLRHQRRGC